MSVLPLFFFRTTALMSDTFYRDTWRDDNTHHTIWGSTDCNSRGDELLEDILFYNLCLLNQGNEPTFITKNRKEVIDLTVCNNTCFPFIKDWRVSSEITLPDHCLINFSIAGPTVIAQDYRNPRKTNWGSYIAEAEDMTSRVSGKFSSIVGFGVSCWRVATGYSPIVLSKL